jgi:cytochrome c-type biogenesis protein
MYRSVFVLLLAAAVSFNCSKKDESSKQDVKPNDYNQQNQQQTKQQGSDGDNTSTQTSSPVSYAVKSVGNTKAKNEMVDFSWNENGKDVKLSDYKGKVILLNFWATWCPPCRKELPDLSQISTELKDRDFVMIGVSVDDNQEVLNKFLETNRLPYTIVFEPNELVAKYMTAAGQTQNVVPQTYIINKEGKVVESILGSRSKADFLSLINKHL